ncbi:putative coiled-coil protein SlyX [Rhizobium sp. BK650]|nr:putative coiled-coil protein SlyX [Rhizobium sp. BK650]
MTDIRTRGFKTKADLDEYLADIEAAAGAEETALPSVDDPVERQEAVELARMQKDLTLLRRRLALLREQARTSVLARAKPADRRAHQLRNYPWLKLAGCIAMALLVVGRLRPLRHSAMRGISLPAFRFD